MLNETKSHTRSVPQGWELVGKQDQLFTQLQAAITFTGAFTAKGNNTSSNIISSQPLNNKSSSHLTVCW